MKELELQVINNPESAEKPAILYHASRNPTITEFEPREEKVRSSEDGPLVFATSDKTYASAFLIPWDDSWAHCVNHNSIVVLAVSDRERFCTEDKGGAIYELPSDSFSNIEPGTDHPEWKSAEKVKPIQVEKVSSAIEAMLENGVQLYFVDHGMFDQIRADTNNAGLDLLRTLHSENDIRGINAKSF